MKMYMLICMFSQNCILILDFHVAAPLQPGTLVYMTAFVNVNAIYIRKLDDHNDGFDEFLDKVNQYCLAGKYLLTLKQKKH